MSPRQYRIVICVRISSVSHSIYDVDSTDHHDEPHRSIDQHGTEDGSGDVQRSIRYLLGQMDGGIGSYKRRDVA